MALSYSPLEGSPDRGCAPVAALERYMLFLVIWLFPLTVYFSFKYQFFFMWWPESRFFARLPT